MRAFWGALAGSFVGKILAVVFIAIGLALGFGPDEWAAFMIAELPPWWTPSRARLAFVSGAVITALGLFWPIIRNRIWAAPTRSSTAAMIEARTVSPVIEGEAKPERIVNDVIGMGTRARMSIANVHVQLFDPPSVTYDLVNVGGMPATGLVYGVWCHLDQFPDDNPKPETLRPNPEWSFQIIEPQEVLSCKTLLNARGSSTTNSAFHGYDQRAPLSAVSWEWLSSAGIHNLFVAISVSYWDGFHNKYSTVSHHLHNPDDGSWARIYYREDVRID